MNSSANGATRNAWIRKASLALLGATIGCREQKTYKVGMIPKGRSHSFWLNVRAGALVARDGEPKIDLVWHGPPRETDVDGQIEIVNRMVRSHYDAIAIAPIDEERLSSTLRNAVTHNIRIFVFDSPLVGNEISSEITTDNENAGALAAEYVRKVLKDRGTVAMLTGRQGSRSTIDREKGFRDRLLTISPRIEVVAQESGGAEIGSSQAP